jgi:hypothetical protein
VQLFLKLEVLITTNLIGWRIVYFLKNYYIFLYPQFLHKNSMQKLNKLEAIPLHEIANTTDPKVLEVWVAEQQLQLKEDWLWPQIVAHYTRWNLILDPNGVVDIPKTLRINICSDWDLGLWRLVNRVNRSHLVRRQSDPGSVNWSSLAPTIMLAQKRDRGVPYQSWPLIGLDRVISKDLYECLLWARQNPHLCDLGSQELVELRQQGLLYKTGQKQGRYKSALTTWQLTGLAEPWRSVPKLVLTMLTQIWVCHPQLRTPYLILDPWTWDRMPQPLVPDEIFASALVEGPKHVKVADMPWDD